MNAMSIIYSQHYFNTLVEETFWEHLTLLKVQFCFEKFIGMMVDWVKTPTLLDESKFDYGACLLNTIMHNNHYITLKLSLTCNPVT
jgi:hypothetical protein